MFIGIKQNYSIAKYYYELSISNPKSLNRIGEMYLNGFGVNHNYIAAFQYFNLGAKEDKQAQCNLGRMYYYGLYVNQSYENAKYFFILSAEQDYDVSQNYLGDMYRNGYGVNRDISKAKYYYDLSSKRGNKTAKKNLDELNLLDKWSNKVKYVYHIYF